MNIKPLDTTFWFLKQNLCAPLYNNLSCDVLIVGGGVAGLTAAYEFNKKGLKVVLLEKYFCGSGASGKSSGFITPDSEFSLRDFYKYYGADDALQLWRFISGGVDLIRSLILEHELDCDYLPLDTVVLASSSRSFENDIKREHEVRVQLGYQSTLYKKDDVPSVLGSSSYFGAIRYSDTFTINAHRYCQSLKEVLKAKAVEIYEDTPVIKVDSNSVKTLYGNVKANNIVLAIDRFLPDLGILENNVYHVLTYLLLSSKLTDRQIKTIFPEKPFMAWDTDLIYNYFRLTKDNRLLVGGSSLFYTYSSSEIHNNITVSKKLSKYIKEKFPELDINFEYMWPGLLGISKDILPLAGRLRKYPNIYVISAATGLHWAAVLGKYAAEHIVNGETKFDNYFNPERNFSIGPILQKIIGKKLSFAISNFMQKKSL